MDKRVGHKPILEYNLYRLRKQTSTFCLDLLGLCLAFVLVFGVASVSANCHEDGFDDGNCEETGTPPPEEQPESPANDTSSSQSRPAPVPLQLRTPTEDLPGDLGELIESLFNWSLRIIGLLLFVRFFWAGVMWFTAAGNSATINKAQDMMKNAALGALVLFSAYLILYTINPDLVRSTVRLKDPGTVIPSGPNNQN